jgi:hypothetical protein
VEAADVRALLLCIETSSTKTPKKSNRTPPLGRCTMRFGATPAHTNAATTIVLGGL